MEKNRITILDGFRVIAILVVMLFHFYDLYQNKKYQYNFSLTYIFSFGRLGVQFFFIISGFVITLTLTKCANFSEFIKKRFLRLMPAMFICSLITFSTMKAFDNNFIWKQSHSIKNLILSNTFVSPDLINTLFGSSFNYIDGAYWSLWVEICFYFIIGLFYFVNKTKFLQNFTITSIIFTVIFFLFTSSTLSGIISTVCGDWLVLIGKKIIAIFNIFYYANWFLLGILLFKLFEEKTLKYLVFFTVVFIFECFRTSVTYRDVLFLITIYILLVIFIFKPTLICFLGSNFFSKLGVVSYSVYLIHENIGVLIINKFSQFAGSYNWTIGIILIIIFFIFGLFSYNYLEKPLGLKLKSLMFKTNSTST